MGMGKGTGFGLRERDRDGIGLGHYRLRTTKNQVRPRFFIQNSLVDVCKWFKTTQHAQIPQFATFDLTIGPLEAKLCSEVFNWSTVPVPDHYRGPI